ncbi:FAD/NAD(P)-binding protein [Kitasatospora aburaviensis]
MRGRSLPDRRAGPGRGGPGSVTVFEPSPDLWRGRAYQVDTETLRVNATPDDMSVQAGDPGHFERWLAARDRATGGPAEFDPGPASASPRAPSTASTWSRPRAAALADLRRQGWQVNLIGEPVTAADRGPDEVVLRSGRGGVRSRPRGPPVGGDRPQGSSPPRRRGGLRGRPVPGPGPAPADRRGRPRGRPRQRPDRRRHRARSPPRATAARSACSPGAVSCPGSGSARSPSSCGTSPPSGCGRWPGGGATCRSTTSAP